ncbi:hypothetical protein LCGC14_2009640, partial [marine sediment metagenome]
MIEELIDAQWDQMYGTSIPQLRFFVPTNLFWRKLKKLSSRFSMIIDCGTGNGDLPKEAMARNIKMAGVDIIHRKGNDPCEVQIIPAHRMPFSPDIWALACRPNHSGWCCNLQELATESGAGFIYVGMPNNMDTDVDLDLNPPDDLILD